MVEPNVVVLDSTYCVTSVWMIRVARLFIFTLILEHLLHLVAFSLDGRNLSKLKYLSHPGPFSKTIYEWIRFAIHLIEIPTVTILLVLHSFECLVMAHMIQSENGISVEEMMVVDYSSGKPQSY